MIIEICLLMISLICFFFTVSYAFILYFRRRVKLSWRNLRDLYKTKFAHHTEIFNIARLTYSDESEVLKTMYMALLKCERAVSPKEYTQANKRLLLAFMKFEKLKEKYPLLYENEKFASIKDTLIILEEKIAFSKQFYNKEIAEYNKRVFSIPLKVVSSIFNFKLL